MGLALPDIIDLGRKQIFENETASSIRAALTDGRFSDLEGFLAWLKDETAELIPAPTPVPRSARP